MTGTTVRPKEGGVIIHENCSLRRLAHGHQKIALDLWKAERETMDYLGEWHTHPEAVPTPSSIDTGEWRKICAKKSDFMMFLILGTRNVLWVGAGRRGELRGETADVPSES
ncbi:Mov34/MPN/PAD-1 family protein [Burkholderia pseudomultivorans]|uniref:Mov34/MPN/PAD-1 family protein n=1 Tax=Burkholderia pseudomultivorans TaxID=1207504 RepID=UPI0022AA4117|nr:Mov34/MPN/PAD-1 family protein [Burkholderia pseudomultivorans]